MIPIARRLIVCVALLTGASCNKSDPPVESSRLTIFATLYPLAEIAREVGDGDVRVDWLIDLGKPLSGFTLTRRERDRLLSTDFQLCDSYRRTESFAADDLSVRQRGGSVLTLDTLPLAGALPPQGLLYLDPLTVRQYAPAMAEAFARAAPAHAAAFSRRSAALVASLDAVIAQYPKKVFGAGKVIVLATTFDVLLNRFGVTSVLEDRDVYRLSDADLAAIARTSVRSGAKSLIVPFDLPSGAVSRIEAGTGLKAFALDPLGYAGLTGHDTYLDLVSFNLEQLRAATAQ